MVSLEDAVKNHSPGAFEPHPFYVAEGDCVIFYFKEEESYADRVDGLLTLYRAESTGEVTGFQLKGVRRIVEQLGKFVTPIADGGIELGWIVLGYAANRQSRPADDPVEHISSAVRAAGARLESGELVCA